MKAVAVALGACALVLGVLAATGSGAVPPSDFQDAAWIGGKARNIYGSFSAPPAKPGTVQVFVAGPVNADDPLDDLTLDPHFPYVHDHVTDPTPYQRRQVGDFLVLRPGPNATPGNPRMRTVTADPDIEPIEPDDGSFEVTPTLDMPYAIDLGHGFKPLTSTAIVRKGIQAGILRTVEIATDVTIVGWSGAAAPGH